jgi:hypothetical protein
MNIRLILAGDNPPENVDVIVTCRFRAHPKSQTFRDNPVTISACNRGRRAVADRDRIYFAQRAAEEQQLAADASNPQVAKAHRKLQRVYLERASVGDRPDARHETIG